VASLLSASDIFVLPSLGEGISSSLLEASASGLAVIATSVGGNRDIVTKETGILVPPGDAKSLAKAIESLASDPQRGCALGRRGFERVKTLFDWNYIVKRYENICHTVVRGREFFE